VWAFPGVRSLAATLFLILGLLSLPRAASAASFDCAKAGTPTEKAVCADPALSKLDEQVAAGFRAGLSKWPAGNWATYLRNEQRDWLKDRDSICKADRACLRRDYELRLGFLNKPDIKWMGRYVAGKCPQDGRYLDVTPNHPQAGVEAMLYICPDMAGNVLFQGDGVPDANGLLTIVEPGGCRRSFRFAQDTVTLSSAGPLCGVSFETDMVYRRDPAKSPYRLKD
jgi:uncharacterized protein